jgi:hypothetical protein
MTWLLIHWHIALWWLRYANGCTTIVQSTKATENGPQTRWWVLAQCLCDYWHTAAVAARCAKGFCPIFNSQGCRRRVVAKSAGSEDPDFTSRMRYFMDRTVALKRPIFKLEKVFTYLSLGLNYCSIGPSRPPSCGTVPLRFLKKFVLPMSSGSKRTPFSRQSADSCKLDAS